MMMMQRLGPQIDQGWLERLAESAPTYSVEDFRCKGSLLGNLQEYPDDFHS